MNGQTFIFGKPVDGEYFTDREEETKRLAANFRGGVSTFLLSPRRWGKTSLVKKVMREVESDTLKVVFLSASLQLSLLKVWLRLYCRRRLQKRRSL